MVFTSAAGSTANGAEVSGAVGSQLVIGSAAECGAATATAGTSPAVIAVNWAIVVVVAGLLAWLAWRLVRRLRRRRAGVT